MSKPVNHTDLFIADIDSILAKLSAFSGAQKSLLSCPQQTPQFLGQGAALTTVTTGDVTIGLEAARQDLGNKPGTDTSEAFMMASSSAAGSLRMTVHGSTQDMTLRAAREVDISGLTLNDPRLAILGTSSDHLLVDVTAAAGSIRVGDKVAFVLHYSALLPAMTSPYVEKRPLAAPSVAAR